jgi:hypothetical protein
MCIIDKEIPEHNVFRFLSINLIFKSMRYTFFFLLLLAFSSCQKDVHKLQFVTESNTPVDSVSIRCSPEALIMTFTEIQKDKPQTVTLFPCGSKNYIGPCTVTVYNSGKPPLKKTFGSYSGYTGLTEDYTITLTNKDAITVEIGYIYSELHMGLLAWQLFVVILLAGLIYAVIKLYRKTIKFLDKNS